MKIQIHRTHWYRGGVFHLNQWRFNGGDCYTSYRIGPILIKVRQ